MEDAELLNDHFLFEGSGGLYNRKFSEAKADDYFSSRWFLNEYAKKTGENVLSVKELAARNDTASSAVFNDFGRNLGTFLFSILSEFDCDELVIGGNIARASSRFKHSLQNNLHQFAGGLKIIYCEDTEECILAGAALLAEEKINNSSIHGSLSAKRKATQPILPVKTPATAAAGYNVYPYMQSGHPVFKGFETLAEKVKDEKIVIIDGFGGVLWDQFIAQLKRTLHPVKKKIFWYDIAVCMKESNQVNDLIRDSLAESDPVFGKKYNGSLNDFFDQHLLKLIQPDPSADLCIVYGTGAALAGWKGMLVYVDVPKNEIQYRMRAGSVRNLGSNNDLENSQTYRRFYFVDWPVLNKHKESLLPQIDCLVDEQRINEITWMDGSDFRSTLDDILEQPIRARPWFESGIWGGHWMKKNFKGLNENEVNYAWSFELITPENGIVIEGSNYLLEASFDFLLFRNNKKLMGKAAARFGKEFPIRFDFLDTYVGGNLSIQCHPRPQFIKDKFGESFTQDETYYILDCEEGAKVYLGFQNDINPGEFKTALLDAQNKGVELQVEKFVQKMDTHKHDLYLIPNGTVHASGKNNLVLEISSTPYIFTFKMYDWLRLDLNGQPRPINIEYAFDNLYFDRKGDYVSDFLISRPQLTEEWENGRKMKLPTHEEHFYTIDRYEFTGTISIKTNSQFHICMLVNGKSIQVITANTTRKFSYAETFVIPASIVNYEVQYQGRERAYLVVAYVKDACC